jgi:hypothetical protein
MMERLSNACAVLLIVAGLWTPGIRAENRTSAGFAYISPLPGATYVNCRTTLAFRSSDVIAEESLAGVRIILHGSLSGVQTGVLRLARDQRTILCTPPAAFSPGEDVSVTLPVGVRTRGAVRLEALSYSFRTSTMGEKRPLPRAQQAITKRRVAGDQHVSGAPPVQPPSVTNVPANFPPIRVLKNTTPDADPVFMSNFSWGETGTPEYIFILYRDGTPAYYKKIFGWDFKRQPSGMLTYYDQIVKTFYGMDSAYQVVDSFYCGNGYSANEHELQLLPDGRAWLLAYDLQMVAMDTVVPGGNPEALVTGVIVQEIDRDKNVIFEWRSWDHFRITDATHERLTAADIDAVHTNAIHVDADSNIIISNRNLDEVTKISTATGEILWRMGGKNNEFTLNDPVGWFDQQHAAYRLPNGHLTVFDNGTYRGWSRAVEYAIDESLKVATKVWEYNAGYNILGWAMGNVQRLPNGNTMIGWGSANPVLSEVSSAGTLLYQIDMRESEHTYRAFTFPWQTNAFVPAQDTLVAEPTTVGRTARLLLPVSNPTAHDIVLTAFRTRSAFFAPDTADSVYLPAGGSFMLPLHFRPASVGTVIDTLELRSEDSRQGIIRRVFLRGTGVAPALAVTPSALQFGTIPADSLVHRMLTVAPVTTDTVSVDSIAWHSSTISVSRTAFTVSGPESVLVTFASRPAGIIRDTLVFHGDSGHVLARVPLEATVVAPHLSCYPESLAFASVKPGDSVSMTVSVRNISGTAIRVDSVRVHGVPFSIFIIVPATVAPYDSMKLYVRFLPEAFVTYRDTLTLFTDAGIYVVPLVGKGGDPLVGITPPGTREIPSAFALSQNYPNPFNPATSFTLGVPVTSAVSMVVYDALGREIGVLVRGVLEPGFHRVTWSTAGAASGWYVCRCTAVPVNGGSAAAFTESRKLLLLR